MKYKAVISDIDGTLTLPSPIALPSKKVKDAVKKLQEEGIIFTFASARPFEMLKYLIEDLCVDAPVITNNGATIHHSKTGKILWYEALDRKIFFEIKNKYKKLDIDADTSNGIVSRPEELKKEAELFKIVILGMSEAKCRKISKELEARYKNISVVVTASFAGAGLLDVYIADAKATKQYAMLKLSDILKISTKDMIAIGDHYNDFPLFLAAGFKIAMGNAVEDLKEIADYVAPSVEHDGFAVAMEKYILNTN